MNLLDSDSDEVRLVSRLAARDLRSNLGRNLNYLRIETGLDPWQFGTKRLRQELMRHHASEVPPCDEWCIKYAYKLINQRLTAFYNGDEDGYNNVNIISRCEVTFGMKNKLFP